MIKAMAVTLSLMVVLSGCATTNPNSSDAASKSPYSGEIIESMSSDSADNPILEELMAAVEAVELNYARIDVNGSLYGDPESVYVTKELLRDIGNAILSGNPKRLEPPARGATNAGQDIMVQFPFGDNQYACIQLFSDTDEQPDKTLMWLQLGEEMSQYTLEPSVFDEVQKLVSAQTFSKELVLEGDYVRYAPLSVNMSGIFHSGLYLEDVLETGGKLLFLWREEDGFWLEAVNPETGEAEVIWEYASPKDSHWESLKLEEADYGQFDYRITGSRVVIYRSSGNPAASKIFEAPIDAGDGSGRSSFDIHPGTGQIAYSKDDGVYTGLENHMVKILDNKDTPQPSRGEMSPVPEEFSAYYGEVHLLNGGRQLAALVIHPGSQSGRQSLVLVDIDTGHVTAFDNLFSAMVADVRYIGDKTIAAISLEQVTIIDAESKQTERRLFDVEALTNDFNIYVALRQIKDETGIPRGSITAYKLEPPSQEQQMLRVTGENAQLSKVTAHYAILLCKDSKDAFIAMVPLQK